mmetsp:Transcript_49316/g.142911  ORF Transcript_49316/g.142911 Transcript_49316/m.142911 type:complete len:207 (-) Transcript_49316:1368-1988(-)
MLRVDEQADGICGDDLRKGELHVRQRLWHCVAVGENEATLHIEHQAHAKAPDERGVPLVVALDEVRGKLVGHPGGHGAEHGLHPRDGGVPARGVAELLVGAGRRLLGHLLGRRGLPCLLLRGPRPDGPAPPGVRAAGREAPGAEGPERGLHAYRRSLWSALVGRWVVPGNLKGLTILDTGQCGLKVTEACDWRASDGDYDSVVGQL